MFKKHSRFQSLDEIFDCGMSYTRTILRKKNLVQSLFKKHSKLQKFDEILHCGMTRFKNINLGVFVQYQNTKIVLKKKNMGIVLINFQNSKNFN